MKVIGIGLSKTGTSTLREALLILGYEKLTSVAPQLIRQIRSNKFDEVDEILANSNGVEDLPWPVLFKYIDNKFPEAKFVLTMRKTPDVWFDSIKSHSLKVGPSGLHKLFYGFYNLWLFRNHMIELYNTHHLEVIEYFKNRPDKLLVVCWEDNKGWGSICEFLNIPEPQIAFPHINKKGDRKRANYAYMQLFKSIIIDLLNFRRYRKDTFLSYVCYQEMPN